MFKKWFSKKRTIAREAQKVCILAAGGCIGQYANLEALNQAMIQEKKQPVGVDYRQQVLLPFKPDELSSPEKRLKKIIIYLL